MRLDGSDVSETYGDRNPILSGLTIERTTAVSDRDADGLPDDWELKFFGNLDQNGAGDSDQDELDNAAELAANTFPNDNDTDNDGLTDSQEIRTTKTDPVKADTDGDRLGDNDELTRYRSNPLKTDSDDDGFSDYYEVRLLTDAASKDSVPKKTLVTVFTGGDAGEGLDLDGTFVYAINVVDSVPIGQVRDANFTEDSVEGVTVLAGGSESNWHPDVQMGDSANDDRIEQLMASIRFSDRGNANRPDLRLTLTNLTVGAPYKLQLLFSEERWARGFDVSIDGRLVVDDFAPFIWQGGYNKTHGIVITHSFIAATTAVNVVLDGRGVSGQGITDGNAILQGATLELVSPNVDSDSDGLPDPWEIEAFGNLAQNASGDPDNDNLTTTGEFTAGTDPTRADSDGDGAPDNTELRLLTDALRSSSRPTNPTISTFTGGDVGERLDLDGQFLYAANATGTEPLGQARDADFTGDEGEGYRIVAQSSATSWRESELGDSPNDEILDQIMTSIRYSSANNAAMPGVTIELGRLVPGRLYKLQLLLAEGRWFRGFDIFFNETQIADDVAPFMFQGGMERATNGVVFTYEFAAATTNASVLLDGRRVSLATLNDFTPILQGFTLEELGLAPTPPRITSAFVSTGGMRVTFESVVGRTYGLQYKTSLSDAPWQDLPNAITANSASTTLSDNTPAHNAAPQGFWRVEMK